MGGIPRIPASLFASVLGLVFCVCRVSVASIELTSPWPDYGGGLANTHRSSAVGPDSTPFLKWAFTIPTNGPTIGSYHAATIGADGAVFFSAYATSGNKRFYALNANGTERWHRDFSGGVGNWSAVDVAGGVYVGRWNAVTGSTSLLKMQQSDGATVWNSSGTDPQPLMQSGPAIAADGTIYAPNDNAQMDALNASGSKIWRAPSGGVAVNPAIAPDGTIVGGMSAVTAVSPDRVV
jgi:outer membrane protein assembly factor BamB